jgi:hypothetical protein
MPNLAFGLRYQWNPLTQCMLYELSKIISQVLAFNCVIKIESIKK